MDNELKDWRGHVIKVDTPVAYPVYQGNSTGIKEGIVIEIGADFLKVRPGLTAPGSSNWSDKPRTLRGSTLDKVVVLPRTNHEANHG